MSETRYPLLLALDVAREIVELLTPGCERIAIAGSLRRQKPDVGDIEILYIPRMVEETDPDNFFGTRLAGVVDTLIKSLIVRGILELRKSITGKTAFGPLNKLMRHVPSGIPVDLFTTTSENWYNYLVCRTGPAELNQRIASLAKAAECMWHPYGPGFTNQVGVMIPMESEQRVFEFVRLPYREPRDRK